jgi:hypothetical protein
LSDEPQTAESGGDGEAGSGSQNEAASSSPRRRVRLTVWLFMAMLMAMLGVCIYGLLYIEQLKQQERPLIVRPDPNSYRQGDQSSRSAHSMMQPDKWQQLLEPPEGKLFDGIPADLPAYEGATRLKVIERPVYGVVNNKRLPEPTWQEQIGTWRIRGGKVEAVAEFYRNAAETAGFKFWGEGLRKEGVVNLNYVRKGSDRLLISVRRLDQTVFLTLTYLYTI